MTPRRGRACVCALAASLALGACDDMSKQHRQHAYRVRGGDPAALAPGVVQSADRPAPPPPLDLALIARGQSTYRAFCVPCHSELGDGHGMIVQRGFSAPEPLDSARIRAETTAHYVDVITNGQGAMYSFAQRIEPADRWAVAAYLRALQRSTQGQIADLSPAQQSALRHGAAGPVPAGAPWASPGLAP